MFKTPLPIRTMPQFSCLHACASAPLNLKCNLPRNRQPYGGPPPYGAPPGSAPRGPPPAGNAPPTASGAGRPAPPGSYAAPNQPGAARGPAPMVSLDLCRLLVRSWLYILSLLFSSPFSRRATTMYRPAKALLLVRTFSRLFFFFGE